MAELNTAEKIETVVLAFLANGTRAGTLGTLTPFDAIPELSAPAGYRVQCDGLTFIVRTDAIGWRVSFGPVVGCDPDLYFAAKLAIESRCGRNVGTVAQALGVTA